MQSFRDQLHFLSFVTLHIILYAESELRFIQSCDLLVIIIQQTFFLFIIFSYVMVLIFKNNDYSFFWHNQKSNAIFIHMMCWCIFANNNKSRRLDVLNKEKRWREIKSGRYRPYHTKSISSYMILLSWTTKSRSIPLKNK